MQQAKGLQQPATMIQFEISHYTQLLERHGESAVERLLVQCADCCRMLMPEHAQMGHISTAQFCIMLPNTDLEHALNHARRLRSELYITTELDGSSTSIATHFAVIHATLEPHETLLSLLDRSQNLLKQSKTRTHSVIQTE